MARPNPIKRTFDLYTSDLSFDEIERLIKRDSAEVYDFFKSEIPKTDKSKNKFYRGFIFIRSLFNAFLLKLTPARRIFYLATILFFIVGFINQTPAYVVLSFIVLNLLLAFELADKLTAKDELVLARKIQAELMPKTITKIDNFEIASFYESAKEVGGDYYDIVSSPVEEGTNFVIIGDISGKGIAAALYMVRVQAIFHSLINNFTDIKEIIINLKNYFLKNLRPEFFLTLAALKISNDNKVSVCRAGHSPILYFNAEEGTMTEINPKGMGIGFNDNGIFEKTLEEIEITPNYGDILFLYTDGVSECMNEYKQQFGIEKIKEVFIKNPTLSSNELKTNLLQKIHQFRRNEPQNDDISFVLLKYNAEANQDTIETPHPQV